MSKIIGLFGGTHNANACYIKDGAIIACYEEEKLKGKKTAFDFGAKPELCLKKLKKDFGVTLQNVDHVCWAESAPGIYREKLNLTNESFYSHHFCHAAGAYFTSNYKKEDKVMVITLDGGGRTSYGKVYLCENNKMDLVNDLPMNVNGSLGQLWMQMTEGFGWKMLKDEGKIMGMAGHGKHDEKIYDLLRSCVDYGNLSFKHSSTTQRAMHVIQYLNELGYFTNEKKRKDIAYNLQELTEDIVGLYIEQLHEKYPKHTKLALAGGIFSNVKMNQKINELDYIDEVYIYPAMGDDGLGLGAALLKAVELGEYSIKKFDNVFLGTTDKLPDDFNKDKKYEVGYWLPGYIADEIEKGNIIAIFSGRSEYGPRALGSRSILVKATDKDMHEKLNKRLKRNEIMPFAPIVLEHHENDIFHCEKSTYAAEFMTMCYTTRDEWIDKIPAVVHKIDSTARPQIVKKDNYPFYSILNAYNDITNVPVLLNTSFNGHGDPIINNLSKALEHLDNGMIDTLIVEKLAIKRK